MKRTFDLKLTGGKWFGLYLLFLVFYIVPVILMQFVSHQMQVNPRDMKLLGEFFGLFAVMMISLCVLMIYLYRVYLRNITFGETFLDFKGHPVKFLFMNIGYMLLSMITLGIYSPWYVKNFTKYLAGETSYKGQSFSFLGKGLPLLGIFIVSLIIPIVILTILMVKVPFFISKGPLVQYITMAIMYLLLVPFYYMIYKWMMNIGYGDKRIVWDTEFLPSIGVIFVEVLLSIITLGIYFPLAILRLYKYFIGHTLALKDNVEVGRFGFNLEAGRMFLTIWGQMLLSIITLGFYIPWAYCKIGKMCLNAMEYETKV